MTQTAPGNEGRGAERNYRRLADLTFDEKRVIRERHYGWEQAKPALLADVFTVPVQTIVAVLKRGG